MSELVPPWLPDALVWTSIALFVATWVLEPRRREYARAVAFAGWSTFGLFWLSLFPHFAFGMKSFIEGALSLLALPVCVYAGYLLYSGRDSLFVLSRAVAVMGIIYLPFEMSVLLRGFLVETVTRQVEWVIYALGYQPTVEVGPNEFRSAFVFTDESGHQFRTFIVLACTGIGSISIFGGLIAAVSAPLGRKLKALALSASIIWVLNIVRNVFIALAFGNQWLQFYVEPIMNLVGYEQPGMVSFFLADRVLAQSLSVVALVGITLLVVRIVPELLVVVEDALYVLTGSEYDLAGAFDGRTVTTDGGRRSIDGGR